MRKRTEKEKEAMGLLAPIFRELSIKKGTRGYEPVMDLISYAYAYPDKKILEIMQNLEKENFYISIKMAKKPEEVEAKIQAAAKKAIVKALEEGKTNQEAEKNANEAAERERIILAEEAKFTLYPSMRRCIATAVEGTDKMTLDKYGLEKLSIILQDGNPIERAKIQEKLLDELGENYSEYKTYEERVIVFFARRLLEYISK